MISTLFGMMMAVASDLPEIENRQQVRARGSTPYLYDDHWRPIGLLAPPNNVVIDTFTDISPSMQDAIVSIEDKRFWTNPGVDIRGIGRAFFADVTGSATQGASTIAQQFVKNALAEEDNRTILEKLREAALAFHLTHEWSKQKILTQYLNSIYFGNGAYGVESAARVYFGDTLGFDQDASARFAGCGDPPRQRVRLGMLAPLSGARCSPALVANPSAFDPVGLPAERARAAPQPGAPATCSSRATSAARSTGKARPSRSPPRARSSNHRSRPRRRTSQAGCVRRSWPRWAGGGVSPQRGPHSAPTTAA